MRHRGTNHGSDNSSFSHTDPEAPFRGPELRDLDLNERHGAIVGWLIILFIYFIAGLLIGAWLW